MMRKNELRAFNKELDSSLFVAKQELKPAFAENEYEVAESLLARGTKVRLVVESSSEWLRVRAFEISEQKEQSSGKTVIYLFKKELDDPDDAGYRKLIEQKIDELFTRVPDRK